MTNSARSRDGSYTISHKRLTAQDEKAVVAWFKGLIATLKEQKISRNDIWNFDKTGFRIGCPKGQQIYVRAFNYKRGNFPDLF